MIATMEKWGIELILKIQAAAMPALDLPMRAISGLGEEVLYILVIPLLYWCVHRAAGLRLFFFLILSVVVNAMGKWILHLPRPYWLDPTVKGMYVETGFGAPSGHSQNALGVWFYLAHLIHKYFKKRFYLLALVLAALISFSRLYLGVHFPHDILLGWLLAVILLIFFIKGADPISNWSNAGTDQMRTIAITLGTTLFITVLLWFVLAFFIIRIPGEWHANSILAHQALGKDTPIQPYSIKTLASSLAMFLAAGLALPLTARYADFNPGGPLLKRVLRYVSGILVFFALYIGLAQLFPGSDHSYYIEFRILRYLILGFWVILGAPYLFLKLGLVERQ